MIKIHGTFEKDLIDWRCDDSLNELFTELVRLKENNPALHNGVRGASLTEVENTNAQNVFSFIRQNESNSVLVVANLSDETQIFRLSDELELGQYLAFRSNKSLIVTHDEMSLPAWGWSVYVRN